MTPEALAQLVASGNTTTVEDEWMNLLESPDTTADGLIDYAVVLSALNEKGKPAEAEALAWAAIESVCERFSEREGLSVARHFLLEMGDNDNLRVQVAQLYSRLYSDRPGCEALLEEAGITGGRPVRRALRTLEVCLPLQEGDYLAERDEGGAARVEAIDTSRWKITVNRGTDVETLGAVRLADRYTPAEVSDFRVMRQFFRDELVERMGSDPVWLVSELCKHNDNQIDSQRLEYLLVPELVGEDEWKRWWTRARAALKKCPNIKITGRSPCLISIVDESAHEEGFLAQFDGLYDPLEKLSLLERFIRDRRQHGAEASKQLLEKCRMHFLQRADRDRKRGEPTTLLNLVIASRVGERAGVDDAAEDAVRALQTASGFDELFTAIRDDSLLELAARTLVTARPDEWKGILAGLLPTLPTATCGKVAKMLVDAGFLRADFEPVVKRILAEPIEYNDALLWLWAGPAKEDEVASPAPITLLNRLLGALEECQRNDEIPKPVAQRISQRSRAVLSARKYERFVQCLDGLEHGVAMALRTQIRRLNNLGRTVHQNLLSLISRRFPQVRPEVTIELWEREDVIYTTRAGLISKQAEIDEHVNVKMRDNARAIGEAAARGDLSENAEYKSALEERDLLRARLAQMNAEMALAQVLDEQGTPTDRVGIGSRAVFRCLTDGRPYELTVTGPWEAKLSEGRLNYKAPLAQVFLGKVVGEVVTFDHDGAVGDFEIVAIENAMTDEHQ